MTAEPRNVWEQTAARAQADGPLDRVVSSLQATAKDAAEAGVKGAVSDYLKTDGRAQIDKVANRVTGIATLVGLAATYFLLRRARCP